MQIFQENHRILKIIFYICNVELNYTAKVECSTPINNVKIYKSF